MFKKKKKNVIVATQVFRGRSIHNPFLTVGSGLRGETKMPFHFTLTNGTHTFISSKEEKAGSMLLFLNNFFKLREEYSTHSMGRSS